MDARASAALKARLEAGRGRANAALEQRLPPSDQRGDRLHEAMRYAVLNGGKRVRAILVYATAAALDGDAPGADVPAAAVEMIHAYSLVHDDLPAMDDDDLRRGVPTCHRAFDEATALLAGDALQTLAFELLATDPALIVPSDRRCRMLGVLAGASGSLGMAGGQAIDLASVGQRIDLEALETMHRHKTGALIRASVMLGALCAGEPATGVGERLERYAECIGLAFQIHDDVLDVEGDTETLGKSVGSDIAQDKPTYPSILGLEDSKRRARSLHEEAVSCLSGLGPPADTLRWLSEYIVTRSH